MVGVGVESVTTCALRTIGLVQIAESKQIKLKSRLQHGVDMESLSGTAAVAYVPAACISETMVAPLLRPLAVQCSLASK